MKKNRIETVLRCVKFKVDLLIFICESHLYIFSRSYKNYCIGLVILHSTCIYLALNFFFKKLSGEINFIKGDIAQLILKEN